jgi:cytochrome c oxidase subunit 1
MFWNLFKGLLKGEYAGDNPWGAATLEWQISSPPPTENFERTPVIRQGPHNFKELQTNG